MNSNLFSLSSIIIYMYFGNLISLSSLCHFTIMLVPLTYSIHFYVQTHTFFYVESFYDVDSDARSQTRG
uniref:Putative ovule protein n=1 Tax=Solanum chacoense TaxID=4108 RepID=A0A0V0GX47_SOLCH